MCRSDTRPPCSISRWGPQRKLIAEGNEGTLNQGPERPRDYSICHDDETDRMLRGMTNRRQGNNARGMFRNCYGIAQNSNVDESSYAQTMFMANQYIRKSGLCEAGRVDKIAIGYKNPLCLHLARQVQHALYSGHVIVTPNHAPTVVRDCEETLEQSKISRKKMHDKMKANECVDNKMKDKALKEQNTRPIKALTMYPPNTPATLVPRVLPTKSQSLMESRYYVEKHKAPNVYVKSRFLELEAELSNLLAEECQPLLVLTNRNPTNIGDPIFQTLHLRLFSNAGRTNRPLYLDIRFGNDHFGAIIGYGDYVVEIVNSPVILRSRGSNLYTISVEDMMKSSPICLLSKASKNKSWLWHRRLNHLNFGTINDLARKDLVKGLPRLKNLHQKTVPRTPQQNGVVERQNQTLVEAARTMLIFSKAPMFLWADVVATACYTQNRSLIHTRHNKTPYELVHNKKPDLTFFRVFGALCYLTNDSKDLGKLQPTADIGIFVGYAPSRKGYRI
ncbi:integrase, catalytic region, zinc finger, CCHC-type containing protein [Tanacetum coccineum]